MMKWHKLVLGFLVGLTLVLSGCGGENASVPVATTPAASPQELAFNPLPVVSEFSGVVVTPPAPVVPITPATELGKLSVSLKTNSQYPLSKDRLTTFNKIFLKIDSVKVRSSTKENSTLESDWEVIPPFLTVCIGRDYAAMASRCFGVNPPKAMLGRS